MSRWLVALLCTSGCAFALSGPNPERPANQAPRCDTSKGLVALDAVVAGAMGLLALSLASSDTDPEIALLPTAIGALYVGGAFSGNSKVNKCRVAMDEFTASREPERMPMPPGRVDEEGDEQAVDARLKYRRERDAQNSPTQAEQPAARVPQVPPQTAPLTAPPPQLPQQTAQAPQTAPAQQTKAKQTSDAPPRKAKPMPKPASDDEWTDFWREVQ